MSSARLPHRIAATIILSVVLFVAALVVALQVVRLNMDRREADRSVPLMELQVGDLRRQLAATTRDYNHWTAAWENISAANWEWVYENYAVTADSGNYLDGIVLFGGPLTQAVAWQARQGTAPQASFLSGDELAFIENALSGETAETAVLIQTSFLRGNMPLLVAAVRVTPTDTSLIADQALTSLPIAVFVRNVTSALLQEFAADLLLSDLHYANSVPLGQPMARLVPRGGGPRSGLTWQPARPGTQLAATMWPLLCIVALGFAGLAVSAGWLARAAVTTLIRQERLAQTEARTDALTGLPNRLAFTERMQGFDRAKPGPVALLFVDLNGFKRINDTIGHDAGDTVVRAFAKRLQDVAAKGDFVARIGGDEFVVILEGEADGATEVFAAQARALGRRLEARQTDVLSVKGFSLTITASQGLAIWDGYDLTAAELVRRADLAMYQGKARRQTEAVVYTDDLDRVQRDDQKIERALRRALERPEEFSVHYQPIVAAGSRRIVRAEALARWQSSELGRVPPDRFVAVAEQTGLITVLGSILLGRIADDMARHPDLSVSLNISPVQLLVPGFIRDFYDVFARQGVAPERIEVELTEGVLVANPDLAAFRLDALHDMGFSTGLDDFGTGFSSIGYLRRMPFDTLKIDRSFLGDESGDAPNLALIQSIVLLGHSIGKTVVFEGVETESQALLLASLGCDLLQGYHFGRPMPLQDLVAAFPDVAAHATAVAIARDA